MRRHDITRPGRPAIPDDLRRQLLTQRLDLLEREREHAERAEATLRRIEDADHDVSDGVAEEARRARALAADALRLGIRDTFRVGASLEELARMSGLDLIDVRSVLSDAGVDPEPER